MHGMACMPTPSHLSTPNCWHTWGEWRRFSTSTHRNLSERASGLCFFGRYQVFEGQVNRFITSDAPRAGCCHQCDKLGNGSSDHAGQPRGQLVFLSSISVWEKWCHKPPLCKYSPLPKRNLLLGLTVLLLVLRPCVLCVQCAVLKACRPDSSKGLCHHEGPLPCILEHFSETHQLWKKHRHISEYVPHWKHISFQAITSSAFSSPVWLYLCKASYPRASRSRNLVWQNLERKEWRSISFCGFASQVTVFILPFVHELCCECLKVKEWMNWSSVCSCDKKHKDMFKSQAGCRFHQRPKCLLSLF